MFRHSPAAFSPATARWNRPLIRNWESGIKGSDIHGFGDSLFFATVQVLTVSSSVKNPLTGVGKVIDVVLELWAIGVVTAVAGSFSTFLGSGDS